MELNQILFIIYPELRDVKVSVLSKYPYMLQNDSDGKGTYIAEWNYEKPQPTKKQLKAVETLYEMSPELLNQDNLNAY